MRRLYIVAVIISCICLLLGHRAAASGEESFITVEELAGVLKTKNIDQILEKLNVVKAMRYQGEMLPFVEDLWTGKSDRHPELPWNIVSLPIVKVELANILLQAERNGRIKTDRERIYRFVEPLVDSADVQLSQAAIFTLSLLDQERAVKSILGIAEREDKGTFRMAVVSLSWMCDPAARKALDYLVVHLKSDEHKSIVDEALKKSAANKKQTGICDSKGN